MSAWSDWKCGALSDEEYREICAIEARRDEYLMSLEEMEESVEREDVE